MTDRYGAGYGNQGGFQSFKGYQKADLKESDPALVLNNGINLEWISGPSPETLFKQKQTQPNEGVIPQNLIEVQPCADIGWTMDKIKKAFVQGPQAGYKTAGFSEKKLTGYRDFNSGCADGPPLISRVEPEDPIPIEVDAFNVNDESSRFRWGMRAYPPNLGKDLPGSMQILQIGHKPGEQIWMEKRKGAKISGRYSGWQSAESSDNGLISTGANI